VSPRGRARRPGGAGEEIRRQHGWLELLQTSGPFLTLPAVHRAFPDGLAAVPQNQRARVRAMVAQMLDDGGASRHGVIETMLRDVLDWQQLRVRMGRTRNVDRGHPDMSDWESLAAELESRKVNGAWLPGPAAALEILGMAGLERAHQAYIFWLLNPAGSHGLETRVLHNVLERFGDARSPLDLTAARVKIEDIRAQSRADIVVSMPERTLVIELKIHSGEGYEQTLRLADDHSSSPDPAFVFLTLDGDRPLDDRFSSMRLSELANALRIALAEAPGPHGPAELRGRATAIDYLYALERKCGMEPVNQHAARFWIRYGADMSQAKGEAARLLKMLPGRIDAALTIVARELGDDVAVARFEYPAQGRSATYSEVAVLLHRPQWRGSSGKPLFGVGAGQRTKDVDPHNRDWSPFFGVWAEDADARAHLRDDGEWNNWAWWAPVDLTPPDDDEDLLDWYVTVAVRDLRRTWLENIEMIDELAARQSSA
jgi:hypothetical protein